MNKFLTLFTEKHIVSIITSERPEREKLFYKTTILVNIEKLQFEFTVVASNKDEKTNIINITPINTKKGKRYVLSAEFRHIGYHKKLIKTENYNTLKNTLKTRHQKRKVWVKMTKGLKNIYINED